MTDRRHGGYASPPEPTGPDDLPVVSGGPAPGGADRDETMPVPEGWSVLYCHRCPASVCWTGEDADTYRDADGLFAAVRWALDQIDHGHPTEREARR